MNNSTQLVEFPILKREFSDLSPVDKLAKVTQSIADYMLAVEARVERANVSTLDADIARYEALGYAALEVNKVKWDLGDQMLSGSGMIGEEDVVRAISGGIDASSDFIGRLRFMARMNPATGTYDALSEMHESINDEQLRLADNCADAVLERFPGLQERLAEGEGGDPDEVVAEYFTEKFGGRFNPPSYMSFVIWFKKEMRAWKNLSEQGSEFAERAYHSAHIQRHQMMTYIKGLAISVSEQQSVDQIVDYDKSGPHFVNHG